MSLALLHYNSPPHVSFSVEGLALAVILIAAGGIIWWVMKRSGTHADAEDQTDA